MQNLVLRKATHEDLGDILRLQIAVFKGEQGIPDELIPIPAEKSPQWWCAILNSTIVGAVATWKECDETHWGRFATMQNFRGYQIGSSLARFSLHELFAQSVDEIHMDARDIIVKTLNRMGGLVVGDSMPFYRGTVTPMILTRSGLIFNR